MVSCQRAPTSHAYAWQIGPFWQDTLDMLSAAKNSYIEFKIWQPRAPHFNLYERYLSLPCWLARVYYSDVTWASWRPKSSETRAFNGLFSWTSKEHRSSTLLALCEGNAPVTGSFPSQRAGNTERVSVLWRHHDEVCPKQQHSGQQTLWMIITMTS